MERPSPAPGGPKTTKGEYNPTRAKLFWTIFIIVVMAVIITTCQLSRNEHAANEFCSAFAVGGSDFQNCKREWYAYMRQHREIR